MDGTVAEVRIFNVVLTCRRDESLLRGYPVRPASQLAYWALNGDYSPETANVGAFPLTLTGTTKSSTHAPIAPSFGWW